MIFIDTPGIHKGKYLLNRLMVKEAMTSLEGSDLILVVVDATKPLTKEDQMVIKAIKKERSQVLLIINKMDLIKKRVAFAPDCRIFFYYLSV